jgi:hypothetical protein
VLSEAHEVLSDESSRADYDRRVAVLRSVHNPLRPSNIKRAISNSIDNLSSRFLLFWSRLFRGDWREEWADIKSEFSSYSPSSVKRTVYLAVKKFTLLPSWSDRARLIAEIVWDNKISIVFWTGLTYFGSLYIQQQRYLNSVELIELF